MAIKVTSSLLPIFFLHIFMVVSAAAAKELHDNNNSSSSKNMTKYDVITFSEENPFKMIAGEYKVIYWSSNISDIHKINVYVDDKFVSYITHREENVSDSVVNGQLNMTGNFVGYNKVHIVLLGKDGQIMSNGSLPVAILLREQRLTQIYFASLAIINMIIFTNMGANMDLLLIKDIIKKPIGPSIGLFCQYVCMPMIAYFLGLIFFPDEPLFRLGLFAGGCSPGGGMSNMWVHLLGGSLDLSMMMTFISSIVALGAVPIWVLTLGRVIVKTNYIIPYTNVIIGILILVVPCIFGVLIQLKCPRFTKVMKQAITPLSVVNIFFIFIFGIYANFYVFSIISWKALVAGLCQSVLGHISGLLLSVLFRRSLPEVIAISIETAIQNYTVGIVLLKLSLESPAGDIALGVTAIQALFMPLPLVVAVTIKTFYERFYKNINLSKKGYYVSDYDLGSVKETNAIQAASSGETNGIISKTLPLLEQFNCPS